MKFCSGCELEKPNESFAKSTDGWHKICSDCRPPKGFPIDTTRLRVLARTHRVSITYLVELYLAQDERCAICKERPEARQLALDHDHESGKVRGFLCRGCNTGLGCFQDSPLRLMEAAAYLRENI